MAVIEIAKIQVRRGQELQTGLPNLDPGEFGWAEDTENLYIGKRVDEGANSNDPTRILVEKDLDIFKTLALNTGSVTSRYVYRDTVSLATTSTGYIRSTESTVQTKLDNFNPSLTDFGVEISGTPVDITTVFRNAVEDLFSNDINAADARRTLIIPPGNYIVNNTIALPPYTRIAGQGPEITRITFTNSTTNLFRTIDSDGNSFVDMQSGAKRARNVYIAGMTLEYSTSTLSDYALISLDNVLDATVEDCYLRTQFDSASTTTYGMVDAGIGIEIRGLGGGVGSGDVNLCENVHITGCRFDSLNVAVESTGSVIRPVISNNVFGNLQQGVVFKTIDSTPPPTNGLITKNRFENIVNEAIYVGQSVDGITTNHLSSDNFFAQVGNGLNLSDFSTTSTGATPIIRFLASGNKTVDDHFQRRVVADQTTSTSFYYNPLVSGSATINDSSNYNITLPPSETTKFAKIGLNGADQHATVTYQMTNNGLSRKGQLLVNIAPDGYASVTDYYNYSQSLTTTGTEFTTVEGSSGINFFVIPIAGNDQFAAVSPDVYYVLGVNAYAGFSAVVKQIDTVTNPGYYTVVTESNSPSFDFSVSGNTYQLAFGDYALPEFSVDYSTSTVQQNYIALQCTNGSASFPFDLEYQIDIQI